MPNMSILRSGGGHEGDIKQVGDTKAEERRHVCPPDGITAGEEKEKKKPPPPPPAENKNRHPTI